MPPSTVESLRARSTRCDTDMIQQQQSKNLKILFCGVSIILRGSANAIPSLLACSSDFERPEQAPRSKAGGQTCLVSARGPPACLAAERARKDPRPEEKNWQMRKKSEFHTYTPIYHRGLGCIFALMVSFSAFQFPHSNCCFPSMIPVFSKQPRRWSLVEMISDR